MMPMPGNVYLMQGPPGCGKTTWVVRRAAELARKYGPSSVLVASLTRTAAREVKAREPSIPACQVGTLHSFAYRALGIRGVKVVDLEDPELDFELPSARTVGRFIALRAADVPRDRWPRKVRRFAAEWEAWKREEGAIEFEDMVERAAVETECAPGRPRWVFIDESQDHSRLDLRLALRWGAAAKWLVLVGDPDQSIFGFRGADPSVFLDVPEERRQVLGQSYRLPRAVHAFAARWIAKVRRRIRVEFRPRDAEGCVRRLDSDLSDNALLVGDLLRCAVEGRTAMVLASCGHMLSELAHALRGAKVPFHNPYRPDVHEWNQPGSGVGRSGARGNGREAPRIVLGTIHSAKGGQADRTYVAPDLSEEAWSDWSWFRRAELRRLFYVAFTRAREELVLLRAATPRAVPWPRG